MHIILQLEFLQPSLVIHFTFPTLLENVLLSEAPRNSLNFLPWVRHTYPPSFISTGKNAIKNISIQPN